MKILEACIFVATVVGSLAVYLWAWDAYCTVWEWTPASGPVAGYQVQWRGSTFMVNEPRFEVSEQVWCDEPDRPIVRAFDAEGRLGPASRLGKLPCDWDVNGDGIVGLVDYGLVSKSLSNLFGASAP